MPPKKRQQAKAATTATPAQVIPAGKFMLVDTQFLKEHFPNLKFGATAAPQMMLENMPHCINIVNDQQRSLYERALGLGDLAGCLRCFTMACPRIMLSSEFAPCSPKFLAAIEQCNDDCPSHKLMAYFRTKVDAARLLKSVCELEQRFVVAKEGSKMCLAAITEILFYIIDNDTDSYVGKESRLPPGEPDILTRLSHCFDDQQAMNEAEVAVGEICQVIVRSAQYYEKMYSAETRDEIRYGVHILTLIIRRLMVVARSAWKEIVSTGILTRMMELWSLYPDKLADHKLDSCLEYEGKYHSVGWSVKRKSITRGRPSSSSSSSSKVAFEVVPLTSTKYPMRTSLQVSRIIYMLNNLLAVYATDSITIDSRDPSSIDTTGGVISACLPGAEREFQAEGSEKVTLSTGSSWTGPTIIAGGSVESMLDTVAKLCADAEKEEEEGEEGKEGEQKVTELDVYYNPARWIMPILAKVRTGLANFFAALHSAHSKELHTMLAFLMRELALISASTPVFVGVVVVDKNRPETRGDKEGLYFGEEHHNKAFMALCIKLLAEQADKFTDDMSPDDWVKRSPEAVRYECLAGIVASALREYAANYDKKNASHFQLKEMEYLIEPPVIELLLQALERFSVLPNWFLTSPSTVGHIAHALFFYSRLPDWIHSKYELIGRAANLARTTRRSIVRAMMAEIVAVTVQKMATWDLTREKVYKPIFKAMFHRQDGLLIGKKSHKMHGNMICSLLTTLMMMLDASMREEDPFTPSRKPWELCELAKFIVDKYQADATIQRFEECSVYSFHAYDARRIAATIHYRFLNDFNHVASHKLDWLPLTKEEVIKDPELDRRSMEEVQNDKKVPQEGSACALFIASMLAADEDDEDSEDDDEEQDPPDDDDDDSDDEEPTSHKRESDISSMD